MTNGKKDLTRIEDLGEFLHEIEAEAENTQEPDIFSLETNEEGEDFKIETEESTAQDESFPIEESSLNFGQEEEPFEVETKEVQPQMDKNLFETEEMNQNSSLISSWNPDNPLTEIETIEEYKAPETLEDLKIFSENSNISSVATEANPSFSVLIKNVRFIEDINDIIIILKELSLLSDSEEQVKARLMRGMLLVPRISEYAAIFLGHKLRRLDIDIQIGLADEIHPSKHQENPEIGIISKFSLHQNQGHHFHFDDPKLELSQIIIAATSTLEGYQVLRYLGVASEHKILDSYLVEDESSDEIPMYYQELALKLKAHALRVNSNAVVGLNYQLTPIPSELGNGGHKYRLTCTGNLVWVNKL